MRKASTLRIMCAVATALIVVAAGTIVALRAAGEPTVVLAAPLGPGLGDPPADASPPTAPLATTPPTTTPPTTTPPTTIAPPAAPPLPNETVGSLRPGDSGTAVLDLQTRLDELGYWLGDPDGSYALLTEQAVMAFQKIDGLVPDGVAGPATGDALAVAERPTSSASGDLIEVDKGRQVLLVVRDGAVAWTLNASTGTEAPYELDGQAELADTPVGPWNVDWVVDGIDVGALGPLYRPRYFHPDGIAVHGYHSVPNFPASHGCVRVSEAAMDWIWANDLMPIDSAVWVH